MKSLTFKIGGIYKIDPEATIKGGVLPCICPKTREYVKVPMKSLMLCLEIERGYEDIYLVVLALEINRKVICNGFHLLEGENNDTL